MLDLVLFEGEETPIREDEHEDSVASSLDEVDVFHLCGGVYVDHTRHLHQAFQHRLYLFRQDCQDAFADLVMRSLPAVSSLSP
jgi:hypothetical protein